MYLSSQNTRFSLFLVGSPVHLELVNNFFSKLLFGRQDRVRHGGRCSVGGGWGRGRCTCPAVSGVPTWLSRPPPLVTVVHSHLINTEQGDPNICTETRPRYKLESLLRVIVALPGVLHLEIFCLALWWLC